MLVLDDLNEECLLEIVSFLPGTDLFSLALSNHRFHRLCDDNALWRRIGKDYGLSDVDYERRRLTITDGGVGADATCFVWCKFVVKDHLHAIRSGILFNKEPFGFVEGSADSYFHSDQDVVDYLLDNPFLSKRRIGDYLCLKEEDVAAYHRQGGEEGSSAGSSSPPSPRFPPKRVLKLFLNTILERAWEDIGGGGGPHLYYDGDGDDDGIADDDKPLLKVDHALHTLFSHLEPSGRSQKIDNLCWLLAKAYHAKGGDHVARWFPTPEALYVLMFSILMLNTDAHHNDIKVPLSFDQWFETTSSSMDERTMTISSPHDLRPMLSGIYERIHRSPLGPGRHRLLQGTLYMQKEGMPRYVLFGAPTTSMVQTYAILVDDHLELYASESCEKLVKKVFGLRNPVRARAVADTCVGRRHRAVPLFPFVLYTRGASSQEKVLCTLAAPTEKQRERWLEMVSMLNDMYRYD